MKSKCNSLYGNANKAMSKFILEMLFQQMKMSGICRGISNKNRQFSQMILLP